MPHEDMPKQWLVSWETDLLKWNEKLPIVVIECFSAPVHQHQGKDNLIVLEQISILISSVIWGCPNPNQHVYSANEIVANSPPKSKAKFGFPESPKKGNVCFLLGWSVQGPIFLKINIYIYIWISCKKT